MPGANCDCSGDCFCEETMLDDTKHAWRNSFNEESGSETIESENLFWSEIEYLAEDRKPLLRSSSSCTWRFSNPEMKAISFWGSAILLFNTISGPGFLVIPMVFQCSGWVVPTIVFIVMCIASSFSATFLTDAIARIPGNSHFERRIEFPCVFGEFFGPRTKTLAEAMLLGCFLSQIVASIVASAQLADSMIVALSPYSTTYAIQMFPSPGLVSWTAPIHTSNDTGGVCRNEMSPFQDSSALLITAGYAVLTVCIFPLGFQTLSDNITLQLASFFLTILLLGAFVWQFTLQGIDTRRVPAFGSSYSNMLGSIVFNYGFVVNIPSWINEKHANVSVNRSVWLSTAVSTALFIGIGYLGAAAYDGINEDFLATLVSRCSPFATRAAALLFAFSTVTLGIPVPSIMARYNLEVSGVCGPRAAAFWAVAAPWLVAWLFYTSDLFSEVVSWSGVLNNGPVNFILPFLVSLKALDAVFWRRPAARGGVGCCGGRWWGAPAEAVGSAGAAGERGETVEEGADASTDVFYLRRGRGALRVACPKDPHDRANSRTLVRPLPKVLAWC
jgi:hypothetical protein